MRARLRLWPILLLLVLPLGCGKSYKLAPVSGNVTLDNHPLANAEVRFIPSGNDKQPSSVGTTDSQGNYELHLENDKKAIGAVPAEYRVLISLDLRRDKEKSKKIM